MWLVSQYTPCTYTPCTHTRARTVHSETRLIRQPPQTFQRDSYIIHLWRWDTFTAHHRGERGLTWDRSVCLGAGRPHAFGHNYWKTVAEIQTQIFKCENWINDAEFETVGGSRRYMILGNWIPVTDILLHSISSLTCYRVRKQLVG